MQDRFRILISFLGAVALVFMVAASGDDTTKSDTTDDGTTTDDVTTTETDPDPVVCDDSDPTYRFVGGRHLCMRECRAGEVGPTGNTCETKEDPANGDLFCDCGI